MSGFLTWLAAARLYPAAQVGIASSAISAMMLCGLIGILGVDMAVVALFPEHRRHPSVLIDNAITVAGIAALVSALIFVAVAAAGLHSLHVLVAKPLDTTLFVILTVLCGVWWVMDQTAVALHRSDHVLSRAIVDGSTTIAGVMLLGAIGLDSAGSILAAWVAAAVVACAMGLRQISRATGGYRFRPRLNRALTRRLLVVGLPNFTLTTSDMAPGFILPLIAVATLSPRSAAYWYTAWMMAFATYQISISFGLHLFAEIAGNTVLIARHTRRAIRSGCAFASVATVVLVIVGPFVLRILGSGYASHGTTPLRLAALASVPMVVMKSYLFACRGLGRAIEGTVAAALSGALALGLAIPGAERFGLTGMAEAWLATQILSAVWAGVRLRSLMAASDPQDDGVTLSAMPARTQPTASPTGVL